MDQSTDIILIGAGIMSTTLGMLLKELEPGLHITILERLDQAAAESSDAWNNAGTGHSAFCELNYTPEREDGSIDITKAVKIAESFELSKEFWAWLVANRNLGNPHQFINSIPHMSFVWGDENVSYLHKRWEALKTVDLFAQMQYTEDREQLMQWIPLVMEGREATQKIAATRMELGTDVNFGALTRALLRKLVDMPGVSCRMAHEVRDIERGDDGRWRVKVKNLTTDEKRTISAGFVFIGAGGGALPLLEKSGIPEAGGFGGFPVSGQWLICNNEAVIARHHAKVYGKATTGTPPMSVPHLDTRMIEGRQALLFGPYAGFSTRFLKHGSLMDLPRSIQWDNIRPMISAGLHNIPLTRYLIQQVRQSPEDRLAALREYLPAARMEDWRLEDAGQRVQVIKKDGKHGGVLEFGTEIVSAADSSIAALLGASPGASTSVSIMLDLLKKCFAGKLATEAWQNKLKEMIPTYGSSLAQDPDLCQRTRAWSSGVLQLHS